MKNPSDLIKDAKDALPNVTPTPSGLKPQSSANDLKSRLDWGEPALTILDVRDRETFNKGHIMGAMSMPLAELVDRAQSSLEPVRDIYVYGGSNEETAQAAANLRQNGFQNVAELTGGFEAWQTIAGSIEGTETNIDPGADAYNVVSRVAAHSQVQPPSLEQSP
jgi:rhodanese-related sulfurtransferase